MSVRPFAAVLVAILLGSVVRAAEPEPGVSGTIERLASSTPEEKAQYATQALEEMRAAERTMQRLQDTAPQCVESRLPLLSALVGVSTIAETNMRTWQASGNTVRADSEFRKIAIALSEARSLLAEAQGCATGNEAAGQDVKKTWEYGGSTTVGDETQASVDFDFDSYGGSPPEASPFM